MPLFLAQVIRKPNGWKPRGNPIGPLHCFAHNTGSVASIPCRGSRMVIGHTRPQIPGIMENMVPYPPRREVVGIAACLFDIRCGNTVGLQLLEIGRIELQRAHIIGAVGVSYPLPRSAPFLFRHGEDDVRRDFILHRRRDRAHHPFLVLWWQIREEHR